jgi:hypothetical protein
MIIEGLPQSIRVGPYDVAVVLVDAFEDDDDCYGYFSNDPPTIQLLQRYASPVLAVDTVLHEIAHAIWWASALPKKRCDEERAIAALAPGFVQVFRDHPELLEWIKSSLSRSGHTRELER